MSARLVAIVESSNDAIIGKDLNGIITTWNRGAERLFGYTEREAMGQPITILMPADRVDEEAVILERIRCGERIEHFETVRRRKDGTFLDISLSVSPIIDAHGKVAGAAKIAHDISARKSAEEEREHLLRHEQAARQEAEAANRVKDEFLAVLSHELRTPLGSILMWANMLKSGSHMDKLPEALEVIERNARLQLRLVEDLLDLNRLSRGEITLDVGAHDLSAAILLPSLESTRFSAETKHVVVEFEAPTKPVVVEGDAVRLQQIFMNVLSNAVKFTPEGGSIRVTLTDQVESVVVKIRDTGEGIATEFLPHVFEIFRQQESEIQTSRGGLGIGLALVKHLVDLHGGNIQIASEGSGLGTEVAVRLPRLTSTPKAQISKKPAASRVS